MRSATTEAPGSLCRYGRASSEGDLPPKKKKKQNKNNPHFHLADELQRIIGVDLTRIDGVDVFVSQTLISEVRLDMTRWKTEAHFASWLGLCPDNRISGDKVLARGTRHVLNRAATALRLGASTLLKSQTYLGAQYRRLRSKFGAPKAITAMAHRWPAWSIACSNMVSSTSTKVTNTTNKETASNKSTLSEKKQPYSASSSHQPIFN